MLWEETAPSSLKEASSLWVKGQSSSPFEKDFLEVLKPINYMLCGQRTWIGLSFVPNIEGLTAGGQKKIALKFAYIGHRVTRKWKPIEENLRYCYF